MEFRIDRGGFSPLGEVGRYSSSRTQKVSGGFRQSFDQIQFSGQPAGMQGRVRQLTAQISQQIRTRPTCHEIEALRPLFRGPRSDRRPHVAAGKGLTYGGFF